MAKGRSNSKPDAACVIALDGQPFTPVGEPTTDPNGQPHRVYRKEVIKVGKFVKDLDGIEFEVTPEVLDHWAASFAQMDEAGVKVPVPDGHFPTSENNRGWVRKLERDGDSLIAEFELIGEDAIAAASRTDVSIFSPPEFVDGAGNKYLRPITHIALTPEPVVPGLGEFTVVASQGKQWKNVPVLRLANGDASMESLQKIADKIGLTIEEGMSDEAILAAILAKLGAMDKAVEEAEAQTEEAVEQAVAAARTKWEAESGKKATKPDPLVVKSVGKSRQMELDALVSAGHITPAARDGLAAAYVGDGYKAVAASLTPDEDDRFDAIVKALKNNTAQELAEKTGHQVIAMSRNAPGNSTDEYDPNVTKRMLQQAGVDPAKVAI